MTDLDDAADSAEHQEAADPIESADAAEPTDPMLAIDPTEPIDRMLPSEAMLSTESCEATDHFELLMSFLSVPLDAGLPLGGDSPDFSGSSAPV